MFEAAVSKFVKSVGPETLVPVPDLDEADKCRVMQVVVRRQRTWFWQSPKYEVSPFKLNQLLTDESEFKDVPTKQRPLTTYNKTYNFDLHGKIGAKLKTLISAELNASDVVQVEAKFGDVVKTELDAPTLMDQVASRKLKMDHQFVKRVRDSKRRTLCVIVGSAELVKQGSVHMTTDVEGGTNVDVDLSNVPEIGADETGEDGVEKKSDKTLTVPAGYPVAYTLCQLYVSNDGGLELILDSEGRGGFEAGDADEDDVDGFEDLSLDAQFRGILDLDSSDRQVLRTAVHQMCLKPVDVQTLNSLLKAAMNYAIIGGEAASKKKLEVEGDVAAAQAILRLAGLDIQADDEVTFPRTMTKTGLGIAALFGALMELDDDQTVAISNICDNADGLLYLMSNMLEEDAVRTDDPKLGKLFTECSGTKTFAEKLRFKVEGNTVSGKDTDIQELEGAYRAVYALWCTGEETDQGAWFCNVM